LTVSTVDRGSRYNSAMHAGWLALSVGLALVGCASTNTPADVDLEGTSADPSGREPTATATPPTGSTRRPPRARATSDVPPPPTPSKEDRAAAEALFEEGRAQLEGGKYAEACEAFAKSDALDPAAGTELNLGDCYEKLHEVGKACEAYGRALPRVQSQPDRLKMLGERRTKLNCPNF
jgi:hypothetical protein